MACRPPRPCTPTGWEPNPQDSPAFSVAPFRGAGPNTRPPGCPGQMRLPTAPPAGRQCRRAPRPPHRSELPEGKGSLLSLPVCLIITTSPRPDMSEGGHRPSLDLDTLRALQGTTAGAQGCGVRLPPSPPRVLTAPTLDTHSHTWACAHSMWTPGRTPSVHRE